MEFDCKVFNLSFYRLFWDILKLRCQKYFAIGKMNFFRNCDTSYLNSTSKKAEIEGLVVNFHILNKGVYKLDVKLRYVVLKLRKNYSFTN